MQGNDTHESDLNSQKIPEQTNKYRPLLIFLMSTIAFGGNFAYDLPQALQTQFQRAPLTLSFVQFESLYSAYSTPNILLPFFGGLFINFIGLNKSVLIFTFLAFVGQLLLTMGIVNIHFTLMILGRIVYAVGFEVLTIVQSLIAAKWFSSQDIASVLGWNLGIGYLGSNLNIAFSPLIYSLTERLWVPCGVGIILCFLSFSAGIGYVCLDHFFIKQIEANATTEAFKERQPKCKDFKHLSRLFWVVSVFYYVFYLSIDGVTTTINDQIHERFGFSNTIAGNLVLIYYLQLIFVCPLIGKIADKYGKRVHFLIFAGLLCVSGQLLLGLLPDTTSRGFIVILPLFILGLADSIFETVVWSCLLLTLDQNMTAIGVGLAVSGMNLLNVVGMLALGAIQDKTHEIKHGYLYSQLFCAGVAGLAVLIGIIIWMCDRMGANKLSMPGQDSDSVPDNESLLVTEAGSRKPSTPHHFLHRYKCTYIIVYHTSKKLAE